MFVRIVNHIDFHIKTSMEQLAIPCLPECLNIQTGAFNNALERTNGNRFVSMKRDNDLPSVGMMPFLMAAFLADQHKSVATQDFHHISGTAYRKSLTHVSATSNTFAPGGSETADGSNHNSKASLALHTASSSVSPADAHPGNSGKKAAHRFVSRSCSTISLSFIFKAYFNLTGETSGKPPNFGRPRYIVPHLGERMKRPKGWSRKILGEMVGALRASRSAGLFKPRLRFFPATLYQS